MKVLNNCAASDKLTTTFHVLPTISVLCTNFPSIFCHGSYQRTNSITKNPFWEASIH